MVLDSNSGTPVSPSNAERPVITTPINRGSRTLHRFGDKCWFRGTHYSSLAAEMSPYFVSPMPVDDFLCKFLSDQPQVMPSFSATMFKSVVNSSDEAGIQSLLTIT
ncbi:hypothetical protein F5888DRAFT_1810955 [Russula emetica]|nr:hypothetical protein F5888DRAFT_1810955 [Russula emetica]